MLDHGAEDVSFATIVASGPNSAIPHHQPGSRAVEAGDLLKIDFGALYGGYHSDCTRTVVVGAQPAAWQTELHQLVREAQRAGRHALAPGADAKEVDAAARDIIVAAGYGDQFTHGLGHGVGLEIHEAPALGAGAPGKLEDRMPVTVEPGVYLEGRGGVRIEDTLVVRADGPELLTNTTKDLVIL
jgi:Xaa-Pro aminopeptidase